eukprot:tig00000093_g3520.t1
MTLDEVAQLRERVALLERAMRTYVCEFHGWKSRITISMENIISNGLTIEASFKWAGPPVPGSPVGAAMAAAGAQHAPKHDTGKEEYLPDCATILSKDGSFELCIHKGRLWYALAADKSPWRYEDTGFKVEPHVWYSVGLSYHGFAGRVVVYIDKKAVHRGKAGGPVRATIHPLTLGSRAVSPGNGGALRLAHVRVWSAGRGTDLMGNLYEERASEGAPAGDDGPAALPSSTLVGYWKLDEGFGDVAADATGRQHGTLAGEYGLPQGHCPKPAWALDPSAASLAPINAPPPPKPSA